MTDRDAYYNKAKQEGYRSRAAYKLKQIDATVDLFTPGDTVIDLGAAPGGWLQVAAEAVGPSGRVIGVDRQRIEALEDHDVETVRGDMTADDTKAAIRDVAGEDIDVVVSDMAPNVTGEYDLDHARSVHLAREALQTARDLLAPGGDFVVKVFDGRDFDAFVDDVDSEFEYARSVRPDATRDSSSEVYVVGKAFLRIPVSVGEELDVEIDDVGKRGDGVALVEGYTLFVPETEPGDSVTVRVTDVTSNAGFAERIE